MKKLLFILLLVVIPAAYGQTPTTTPDVSIVNTVTQAMAAVASSKILPQALTWCGALMFAQMILTNINVLKSGGTIETAIAKVMGCLLWFAFCAILINQGPEIIDAIGVQVLTKFASSIPSPSSIILTTLGVCTSILIGIAAVGTSIMGVGNTSIGMVLVYVLFIILGLGLYMALKVILMYLELGLVVMLAPVSFGLLPMHALKDQGIAPFKSLISLTYRVILLGTIFGAFNTVIPVMTGQLKAIDWTVPTQWPTAIEAIVAMACAFPALAYLAYKSDSIAATLASGSTSMGPADIASAVAAGTAAGAALAAGGGAATQIPQSMADFKKNLGTGSGSISNASESGTGGAPYVGTPPARPPAMSHGPTYDTNKGGAPIQPSSASSPASSGANSGASGNSAAANDPGPATAADTGASTGAAPASGSGANAAISGPNAGAGQQSDLSKKIDEVLAGQQRKPTFGDRVQNLNQQLAQEKVATHASINMGHHD